MMDIFLTNTLERESAANKKNKHGTDDNHGDKRNQSGAEFERGGISHCQAKSFSIQFFGKSKASNELL
ncbi:hypothetical protein [Vibrio nigripulchritudo]|uniref:hypothetical protein n=1 Tax=Vibrio nigripulchritudo TaxID=28173 RepID=UPI001ED98A3D|nr:hypothetical protein [Vibrio nigripulchritudo]